MSRKDAFEQNAFEPIEAAGSRAKSERYRYYARRCLEMAEEAVEQTVRAVLVHMAQVWFRLADRQADDDSRQQSNEDD
jgi:hypothetical protein